MHKRAYFLINSITWYRVITAPLLVIFISTGNLNIFKWMLLASFLTDAIDGFLARKFKVSSIFGARLDSIGDDLTVAAGMVGMFVWKPDYLMSHSLPIIILLALFLIQLSFALSKFGKPTSFHTYLAKIAAVAQGSFLILFFLVPGLSDILFYTAIFLTGLDLLEEIIIVLLIPEWRTNVHGLYWVLKHRIRKAGPDKHLPRS